MNLSEEQQKTIDQVFSQYEEFRYAVKKNGRIVAIYALVVPDLTPAVFEEIAKEIAEKCGIPEKRIATGQTTVEHWATKIDGYIRKTKPEKPNYHVYVFSILKWNR